MLLDKWLKLNPNETLCFVKKSKLNKPKKNGKGKLTVIITNYNCGPYLMESIASVLKQTRMPSAIHIVDDCSTDNSKKIIENIRRNKIMKIFINKLNLGIVDNFNLAVSRVDTEYAMILNSDDYLAENAIADILDTLEMYPTCDIAYFDMFIFGQFSSDLAKRANAKISSDPQGKLDEIYEWNFPNYSNYSLEKLKVSNIICGSAAFRLDSFNLVGGFKKIYPEDHNLWIRMIENGSKVLKVEKTLLYYRQHSIDQANTRLHIQNNPQ